MLPIIIGYMAYQVGNAANKCFIPLSGAKVNWLFGKLVDRRLHSEKGY